MKIKDRSDGATMPFPPEDVLMAKLKNWKDRSASGFPRGVPEK